MSVGMLLDPVLEEHFDAALKSTTGFNQQTLERVNAMKFMVLKVFEREESARGTIGEAGHGQYRKDITTKIVSLVESRAEVVDQFKKAQEVAEFTLVHLKPRLAELRS